MRREAPAVTMSEPRRLPIGEPVAAATPGRPRRSDLEGTYVRLSPLDPPADAPELFAASHGSVGREELWTYMAYGPFADLPAMRSWLETQARSTDPLFFTVHDRERGRRVGMLSFMNVVPEMRRLEVGHIWYSPEAQRTRVNTEALYLTLRHAFEDLGYRRVEWKCDALNERSRRAALRLGFEFEGTFRKHMVVKDRNRDTSWYAIVDDDWPAIRANMEKWLYDGGRRVSLSALHRPVRERG